MEKISASWIVNEKSKKLKRQQGEDIANVTNHLGTKYWYDLYMSFHNSVITGGSINVHIYTWSVML